MCGRYTLTPPLDELEEILGWPCAPDVEHRPRYNVAPTQTVPVAAVGRAGEPRLVAMRWGLVPFWADDVAVGHRMINARAESVATRSAFNESFHRRRCLVPADGFFEWTPAETKGAPKRPFHLRCPDGALLTLAGLWASWRAERGAEPLLSFTILTTDANAVVRPLHDRMPVVVPAARRDAWLDREVDGSGVEDVLRPAPDDLLEAVEVSTWVSDPAHDDPRCIEPLEA